MQENMNEKLLEDVIVYLCIGLASKELLSEKQLTRLIYLADWKYALVHEQELTGIKWTSRRFEPFAPDILVCVEYSKNIVVDYDEFDQPKICITQLYNVQKPVFDSQITAVLDFVIEKTNECSDWKQFEQLVFSTFPLQTQSRFGALDLVLCAKQFKAYREEVEQRKAILANA